MHKKVAVVITPNYKDYGKKYLPDFLPSMRAQDYAGEMKYFITDNESSAESWARLNREIPEADIVRNKNNDGFAKGVNDSIRQALAWPFDYLVVVNIDTVLDKSFIAGLVKAAETDDKIGLVQARIMLFKDKNKINSLGNTSHFLGFGYSLGYKEKLTTNACPERSRGDPRLTIHDIHYPSGVAILFTRQCLERIGLLDEEYWMYNEDQEIGWRAWLAGFRCVLAPEAIIFHKYEFARSIRQYYYMDRNRIITILLCYKLLTLLLILPALMIMELGLTLFSVKGGWFKEKIKVWRYFIAPSTWAYIAKARQRNQKLRQVSDRQIAKLMAGRIWYQEIDDWKLRLVNPVFDLYWKICKFIMIW